MDKIKQIARQMFQKIVDWAVALFLRGFWFIYSDLFPAHRPAFMLSGKKRVAKVPDREVR